MRRTWIVLSLLLLGCGAGGPAVAPVSGRILVDGQPVAGLSVTFSPIGSAGNPNPGPSSLGSTDEHGRYSLSVIQGRKSGAVVGRCRVRVRVSQAIAPNADPQTLRSQRQLPARYNEQSELIFEVPAGGTDTANFDLTWR